MTGYDAYLAAQGEVFTLPDGTSLILQAVTGPERQGGFLTYSLHFLGDGAERSAAGVADLTHARLGELRMFLVDRGKVDEAVAYEAEFSHHLDDGCP